MNGAESLIKTLVASGVEVCFANPGTSEMHFVAALDEVKGMRCVLGLFEGVVSGAADGYARMAGKPAVTLLHLGPGLGNALANIHNARKGHVPMINIIGDHATYHLQYDAPLTSDIEGIAKPVSDWVHTSAAAEDIAADGVQAVQAAGHNRIATLILPADVSWGDNPAGIGQAPVIPPLTQVSSEQIEAAATMLRSGKPSMVLAGGDISLELGRLLNSLALKSGSRVCVETFPTRIRRGAGSAKLEKLPYLAEYAIAFMQDVENLVLIGAQSPVSFFAYPNVPSVITADHCNILSLAAPGDDLLHCAKELLAALGGAAVAPECYAHAVSELPTGELSAQTIAQSISHLLPDNAVVVDEGATSSLVCYPVTASAAPHDWLSLTGGSIGFGLPCAVGASIACPHRKVVCMEGDGSAMYTIQSLWTMARENLDVTVVIFNNSKYNILELEFARTGARGGSPGPKASSMLDIGNPLMDFVAIAQGMGVMATKAGSAEEFNREFAAAMSATGPRVIEAMVPPVRI
jgi:acetolactate synthase-1/2/3 large subunit